MKICCLIYMTKKDTQVKISGRNSEGYSQFSTPVTYSTPSQGKVMLIFHVSLKIALTRPKLAITSAQTKHPQQKTLNIFKFQLYGRS